MSYLTRSKVYHKIEPEKDAKKVYIFCEGVKREIAYLEYFQGLSSNISIIPIPTDNHQSDPVKLKENAIKLFVGTEEFKAKYQLSREYGDEIWFVIDTDRWNEKGKIDELRKFCDNTHHEGVKCWTVAQSNPSFEIWLYYHIYSEKPLMAEVEKHASFKTYVDVLIKGGFDSRKMPVLIETAIFNSENSFLKVGQQPDLFSTELFMLGKVLMPFIKESLAKILAFPVQKDGNGE